MLPTASLLIPVHNEGATLRDALACAAAQTLTEHEVVLVLNGCNDDSAAIAHSAASRDARVRVIELADADIVGALNAGLVACRGPLIARLDADDLMVPERLRRQVEALVEHPDWGVVTTQVECTAVGGGPGGPGMRRLCAWLSSLTTPALLRANRFVDSPVAHPAVMMRAAVVRAAGGYRAGDFTEDHDLWLRLMHAGVVFGMVPEVLVDWRDRPERLTRTDPRLSEEARRRLIHRHLFEGPLEGGARPCVIWGAGRAGKRHARGLVESGAQVDALLDIDPRKVGGRAAGGIPVEAAAALGPPDGRLLLVAVATPGARDEVAARLDALGYLPERDWLAVC